MELIAQRAVKQNIHLKDLIQTRLDHFNNHGLVSSLDYKAKITSLSDLDLYNPNFHRILFNVLSFFNEQSKNRSLKTTVINDSKYLKIEFSFPHGHTRSGLMSLKNGISLLSPRRKPQLSFLAVQRLVSESGGTFSFNCLTSKVPIYCLQIPLSPRTNTENNSPPPKEISRHRFESKGALFEGVFDFQMRKSA